MFRVVLDLSFLKENLLARCKHKLGTAVNALQFSVNKIHNTLPAIGEGSRFPSSHAIAAVGCQRSWAIFVPHEHMLVFVYCMFAGRQTFNVRNKISSSIQQAVASFVPSFVASGHTPVA
jgi:hypothetical protein